MHSSLIGKIQKAHLYAEEPSRVEVHEFSASFRGEGTTTPIPCDTLPSAGAVPVASSPSGACAATSWRRSA
jgi:hypothetical protein